MLEREIIEMVWKHLTLATMHLFCCAFVQNNANPLEVLENILGIPFTLLNKFSPPVTDLPSPDNIIRQHGYPAERHTIETADGYLLGYYRIPYGRCRNSSSTNKPYPVLLHHGYLSASIDWVVTNESLAYLLADDGYDVWMGNLRGSTYSLGHVSLTTVEGAYWNFSFTEIGMYDIPAAIDYILKITKAEKLVYVGHSLGTTIFYVTAATRPEYNEKVLFQISLAPVAGLQHTASSLRLLVPALKPLQPVPPEGPVEHSKIILFLIKLFCGTSTQMASFSACGRFIEASVLGYDPAQFNKNIMSVVTSYFVTGFSIKLLIHLSEMIDPGEFGYYDYGPLENINMYNNVRPPTFNLSSMRVPMKLYQGKNDILADIFDTQLLYEKLPMPMGLTFIDFEKWCHLDFVYAVDIRKYLNKQLLEFIQDVTGNPASIDMMVQTARKERNRTATPVDKPVNETDFINKVQ